MRYCLVTVALALIGLPSPALADEAEGDTIVVTGVGSAYDADESSSGSKTRTPILDLPQSISVVTKEQITDQNVRTIADLVRLVPGTSAGQGEGHRDQINLRGNNTTADFFIDGLRDDAQYFRSFYNIERVEVLKGPNSMIFGRGGGGGVINRVTKGALMESTLASASAAVDSFGAWMLSADANLPVGTAAAFRLNAFYEQLSNHRDAFDGDRVGINPVIGAQLGKLQLQLGYEYVQDDRTIDRGIPSAFTGTIGAPAGPATAVRDSFFGVTGVNRGKVEAHVVNFRSRAELNDSLTVTAQALWADYDKAYANAFAATAISASGTIGFEAYRDLNKRRNFIGQANLEWRTRLGGLEHTILIGGEVTSQNSRNDRINGFFNPTLLTAANRRATVAVTNPLVIPPISFVSGASGNSNRSVTSDLSQVSAYVQDQIKLGDGFEVIAGLRYDRLRLAVTNKFSGAVVDQVDHLWSPRIGLVFKPAPNASFYLSRSKSYLPQSGDQFVTFDANFAALEPEIFDNLEAGVKWDIRSCLSATAAIYQLDRKNTRAAGPAAGTFVLTGSQRTRGIELSITGRITPHWQTSVGYAHTIAEISKTTSAAPAGRTVGQVPRHTLSLWNRYDLSRNIGFGVGLYHQSSSFASISNVSQLPAYTRIDAAIFAKLGKRIEAQLNFENVGNATYFPAAHNDNNISVGAPFNVRFSLSLKM
jgi:catecholate siderophore receptor